LFRFFGEPKCKQQLSSSGLRALGLFPRIQRSSSSRASRSAIESDSFEFLRHYARQDTTISFQIPIGISSAPKGGDDVSRPIDHRDVPPGILCLGQLRGRSLPVAVSRFAAQIASALARMFDEAQPR
jgi:hypothetical protein